MPNGAAANLAIGGASPVATLSGKLAAFASGRSELSLMPAGNSMLKFEFSGNGVGNVSELSSFDFSSLSNTGASAVPDAGFSRILAASSRDIGDENVNVIGLIGRHGAFARSRSQVNSAVNAARTLKL